MVHRNTTHRHRGFTLVELAVVMAVIGAVIGAIWWAAGNTREMQKDNDAVSELQSTTQNILSLMSGQSFSAPYGNITSAMITASAIPTTYVDAATPTTVDNPWSPKNLIIWNFAATPRMFRVSFYNTSREGCLALLLQETSCQAGQIGCPTKVWTDGAVGGTPAQSAVPAAGTGWQTTMGSATATTMCAANSYSGGTNSTEFDFSL